LSVDSVFKGRIVSIAEIQADTTAIFCVFAHTAYEGEEQKGENNCFFEHNYLIDNG
jgi:hypothetical protein